eukprot:TRINITY_DN9529_c0_g1_i17.p2 TRINITY_DN9529_c0_g1~~TRINITY_DN9529_c0_g1_i17.p2  ORF type:complete len:151 (+),score=43.57 TRINITY_DN9529_c0_g1_i17:349-801(+)
MKIDWEILTNADMEQSLSSRSIAILKLYFALMGKEYHMYSKKVFIGLAKKFFTVHRSSLAHAMNPESTFSFTCENIERVRVLLRNIKSEIGAARSIHLFDVLTAIVNEGLRFAQTVHNSRANRVEKSVIRRYEKIKNFLQRILVIANSRY